MVALWVTSARAQTPEPWTDSRDNEVSDELPPIPPPPGATVPEPDAPPGTTVREPDAPPGTTVPDPPPAEIEPQELPPVPPPPATSPVAPQPVLVQPPARPRFGWRERLGPQRVPGHRFVLDVLPYVGEATGGLLAIADWIYRSPSGVWSAIRVGPGGFAIENGSRVGVFDASYSLGWEHRFFGFGFGVGVAYARIEEATRRTEGMTPVGLAHIRGGAQEGIHMAGTIGATMVDGKPVATTFRLRFRWALSHRRYLDFELNASGALSYAYGMVAFEMALKRDRNSPWRLRPHVGFAEVIDQVRRVGGPGFSAGIALVYLTPPSED